MSNKKLILLVEDDPFLIDIYQTKLKKAGFKVEVAGSGAKALAFLKNQNPDLMILDIVLPEMGGWEVLKEIKKDAGLKKLKIVVLSNLGQKEEVEKGLELGATKYLIKAQHTPGNVIKEVEKILK